jgi:hypothetical protein
MAGTVVSTSRNTPSHTLLVMQQFLAKENIPVITQSPYSLDLTLSDYWLFLALKMGLTGTCFATTKDNKLNSMAELWKFPKEAFCWCFQQLQDHWCKCVCASKGPALMVFRCIAIYLTITVYYHNSGNFLTAHYNSYQWN